MKFLTLTFVLLATFATVVFAAPEPKPAKSARYRAAQIEEDDTQDDFDDKNFEALDRSKIDEAVGSSKKVEASSGRLFMRRFLLFKKMFNQRPKPSIIPIIITGGGGLSPATTPPTAPTTPTSALTSPPAIIPSATGPAIDTPITATSLREANDDNPPGRIQLYGQSDENDRETEESAAGNEQALAAALGSGAEEYVVTDQEIKGTSDAKAKRDPSLINLRHRGAKRAQIVSVRIPAKYRDYFKKGQRVILNNNSNKKPRPAKRRVVKRRNNRRRPNKNRAKRRRIVADNE